MDAIGGNQRGCYERGVCTFTLKACLIRRLPFIKPPFGSFRHQPPLDARATARSPDPQTVSKVGLKYNICTQLHHVCRLTAKCIAWLSFACDVAVSHTLGRFTDESAARYIVREFRDVVFEDVGFDSNSLLTLKTEGVGTSHLKLIWVRGFESSSSKPHILKHHIPEHPNCPQSMHRTIHMYIGMHAYIEHYERDPDPDTISLRYLNTYVKHVVPSSFVVHISGSGSLGWCLYM